MGSDDGQTSRIIIIQFHSNQLRNNNTEMSTTNVWVAVGSANPCKVEAVRSAFEDLYSHADTSVRIHVTSHNAPSGVSDQPYGDAETKLGAVNRANAAWEDAKTSVPDSVKELGKTVPDFSVGLEGGVEEAPASTAGIMAAARSGCSSGGGGKEESKAPAAVLWCMAWMAIRGTGSATCTLAKAPDSSYKADTDGASDEAVWGFGRTGSFELPPEVARLVHGGMELGDADDRVFNRVKSKHGSGTVGILTRGMIDRSSYYVHSLKLALVPWIRPEMYIE